MIRSFTARIPQDLLEDLKQKISVTRWPDEIPESGWHYGSSMAYMKALANYWLHRFDWRKTESHINAYPNFIADIDNHQLHFMHIKGKGAKSFPLLVTHGWPGSFMEMMPLIPLLTENPQFSFDLIIPSIPGFGFSPAVTQPGMNSQRIADLWCKLMLKLGYTAFGAQGGDLGAGISIALAKSYPQYVKALHLNYIPSSCLPVLNEGEQLTHEENEYRKRQQQWVTDEGAYAHIHATKPLTLAYGLNDSPMGLCAWIVEKYNSWSDNGGSIENCFSKEQLLATVTLYWVTQTIHSSTRLYYENSKSPFQLNPGEKIKTPTGIAQFPQELNFPPRSLAQRVFNIQHWSTFNKGGHFAAMEQPRLLADDITRFFTNL
ncbi:epoxide hydrolase family protein [Deminuibacter soli]|uniref:Epoxide hydrolase n=1 Tax=Deminuibacter soli TaxID=2291815 RepID=A0A3E1NHF6_9BACT|nr:epoxide hydrolase family protein [Deminuibacter soli]RFM27380.1 epoxide hydrolase [Deminuibacter soli]